MKKIVLICPSLRAGGSERVMSELANYWSSNPLLEIYLILLTNQKQYYRIDSRVHIITPKHNYKKNFISKSLFKLKILSFIRSNCLKIQPDSILSFNERYNNIVLLALRGLKLKVYVSDRNSPFMKIGLFHNFLRNKLYKNATGIIAQTQSAKTVLGKNTKNKNIKVIPNPLREIETKKQSKLQFEKKIILNVGRNVEQKNQLELIKIFNNCDYSKWILKIIGSGPLHSALIKKTKELGIEQHVQIIEFTKGIDYYYSEADIFAFTSLYEGFPNALVEAMAHGIACVSYDCPTGPSDIINNGINACLIPLSNSKSYSENLNEMMSNEKLRIKYSNNATDVKRIFSIEKTANNYLDFITYQ